MYYIIHWWRIFSLLNFVILFIYTGLKSLKVRGKDLDALYEDFYGYNELEVLDLSPDRQSCIYYRLPEISPSIGKLINLKILIIDTNELRWISDNKKIIVKIWWRS